LNHHIYNTGCGDDEDSFISPLPPVLDERVEDEEYVQPLDID
jgi:hypothetical protein